MKANMMKKVIEMTKAEANAAGKITSLEFAELNELRAAFPDYRIVIKAAKSKDNMKGLDTSFMMKYIEEHDKSEDQALLKEFYSLRGMDEKGKKKQFGQAVPYGILKQWFLTYFPEVANMSDTIDEILEKAQEKREAAKKAA